MQDYNEIIETLKELLKVKGMTYKGLSEKMDLSEASIKRIFSNNTFSLERLDQICRLLNSSILEVATLAQKSQTSDVYEYSLKQETYLAANPKCLAYFDLLITGSSPGSIQRKFSLSDQSNFRYLNKLDQIGLIDLSEQNKFRFKQSTNIKWRKNGPLRKLFFSRAKFEFLESEFEKNQDYFKISTISLGSGSRKKLELELSELFDKYERNSRIEAKLKMETRSVGLLIATRKWKFSLLSDIKL